MPEPLQYQRATPSGPAVTALIVLMVIAPPVALAVMWFRGGVLHFERELANLVAHGVALLVPMVWAGILLTPPLRYLPTEERVIGETSFLSEIDGSWWMSALMWPAPILGLVLAVRRASEVLAGNGSTLSSRPDEILLLWVTTFVLVLFWVTAIRERAAVRISDEGLRTGNLHFMEWAGFDHVVERGSRLDLYHAANVHVPFSCIRLPDVQARAVFFDHLTRHGVRRERRSSGVFLVLRVLVAVGTLAQLIGGFILQSRLTGNRLWSVDIVFVVGLVATVVLERYRGVAHVTKLKPVMEPEPQGARPDP